MLCTLGKVFLVRDINFSFESVTTGLKKQHTKCLICRLPVLLQLALGLSDGLFSGLFLINEGSKKRNQGRFEFLAQKRKKRKQNTKLPKL